MMKLETCTWLEVEKYLEQSTGIMIPTGSTEQHGPMGLIGTDALCAELIATEAADTANAIVAPTLCYTPAPFNMAFPGTISISEPLFAALVTEIVDGLVGQGFRHFYFVNAHGANLEPLKKVADAQSQIKFRIKSWWEFDAVNLLRKKYYGDWEGMHATPSEVSITQAYHRSIPAGIAQTPPEKLSPAYMAAHSGDRHGPPDQHRKDFPDGRVGSHSALANPEHGREIVKAAQAAIAEDYIQFLNS